MTTLFSIFVFGEEMQNCNMATFGFSIFKGAPGADNGILSANKTPLNN